MNIHKIGQHETASYDKFSSGVADRGSSIRIPRQCVADGCGYLEDRRPAANCDPYAVTETIVRTVVLNELDGKWTRVLTLTLWTFLLAKGLYGYVYRPFTQSIYPHRWASNSISRVSNLLIHYLVFLVS